MEQFVPRAVVARQSVALRRRSMAPDRCADSPIWEGAKAARRQNAREGRLTDTDELDPRAWASRWKASASRTKNSPPVNSVHSEVIAFTASPLTCIVSATAP